VRKINYTSLHLSVTYQQINQLSDLHDLCCRHCSQNVVNQARRSWKLPQGKAYLTAQMNFCMHLHSSSNLDKYWDRKSPQKWTQVIVSYIESVTVKATLLLRDINEFLCELSRFVSFRWDSIKRHEHRAIKKFWVLWKSAQRRPHYSYRHKLNYIYMHTNILLSISTHPCCSTNIRH
jgi:hypothetical protein